MLDTGKEAAIGKKAYEIAYALFRVAANMEERGIAETLKSEVLRILGAVAVRDYQEVEKPFETLDYFVKLAMDVNAIGFANGDILIKELGNLRIAVAECAQKKDEAVDISGFFSKDAAGVISRNESATSQVVSPDHFFSQEGIAVSRAEEYQEGAHFVDKPHRRAFSGVNSEHNFSTASVAVSEPKNESGDHASGNFLKSGMRQIAILDKIRQSGSCRLRDLHEVLPDSSERTIRYDLEDLIERRLIERIGNGGPSVSYRMRQI